MVNDTQEIKMDKCVEDAHLSEAKQEFGLEKTNKSCAEIDVIIPATTPLPGQPSRYTNRMDFIYMEIVKNLWNHETAWIFTEPVNTTVWNIPDYYKVITDPIDLGTIRKRLMNKYYYTADECISDIRRMFRNYYKYNGVENAFAPQARIYEEEFEKMFKKIPSVEVEVPLKQPLQNRRFNAVNNKNRTNHFTPLRRKLNMIKNMMKQRQVQRSNAPKLEKGKNQLSPTQLNTKSVPSLEACRNIVDDLVSVKHMEYAWPFYQEDRSVLLSKIDYNQIIEHPTDLSKIRNKLITGVYPNAEAFVNDMRLMFSNFYKFYQLYDHALEMGRRLQNEFEMLFAKTSFYSAHVYPDILNFQNIMNIESDLEKMAKFVNQALIKK